MVEKHAGCMQGNKRHKQIGEEFMRRHRRFGQHLVWADHRRQLAEKVEVDAPPPRIGVQQTEGGLKQYQDIKDIFGGPRRQFLKEQKLGRKRGGSVQSIAMPGETESVQEW
jgi:hypothetical protein